MDIYVYIMISKKDGSFYFGQSTNPLNTLQLHNAGRSEYTKPRIPWQLLAFKKFDNRTEALRTEMELRKIKNAQRILQYMLYNEFQVVREEDSPIFK
ncbi:MAG: hypothetical protein Kow0068_24590 [Marinilabiliales bacterium]